MCMCFFSPPPAIDEMIIGRTRSHRGRDDVEQVLPQGRQGHTAVRAGGRGRIDVPPRRERRGAGRRSHLERRRGIAGASSRRADPRLPFFFRPRWLVARRADSIFRPVPPPAPSFDA